jgi:hypothetical protein
MKHNPMLPKLWGSFAGAAILLAVSACSQGNATETASTPPPVVATGPAADIRVLTGAPTRIVWVQGDGTDPETNENTTLILLGMDTEDGRGERVIVGKPGKYLKPRLTSKADRIVFSTRVVPGPSEIFIVNWDGSGLRKLADGFALTLWRNPADGSDWVYQGIDNREYDFARVMRFPVDAPEKRELVWDKTLVSMEGFAVSPDGRFAGGMWPWPNAGVADLRTKTVKKLGEGCWTSMTYARGPLFWYFDGAHRNITMVDVDAGSRWVVNVNNAPGFDGAEASCPRWANHPRFLAITGPYNQGGPNQVRTGGKQVEVYLGRFSADFSYVEQWVRVTTNSGGDVHPDVWIDPTRSPIPRQPHGRIGPAHASAAPPAGVTAAKAMEARLVLNVRLNRATTIPNPQSILPYRHALVVNEYEVMDVIRGKYAAKTIQIAQWVIRDGKVLPDARRLVGSGFTLTVEPYDAHPELEGERRLSDLGQATLPIYYEMPRQ